MQSAVHAGSFMHLACKGRLSLQKANIVFHRIFFTAAWGDLARSQKIALLCWRPFLLHPNINKTIKKGPHHHTWGAFRPALSWTASMVLYAFTAARTKHACLPLQLSSTENGPWLIPHIAFFLGVFGGAKPACRLPRLQLTASIFAGGKTPHKHNWTFCCPLEWYHGHLVMQKKHYSTSLASLASPRPLCILDRPLCSLSPSRLWVHPTRPPPHPVILTSFAHLALQPQPIGWLS